MIDRRRRKEGGRKILKMIFLYCWGNLSGRGKRGKGEKSVRRKRREEKRGWEKKKPESEGE